MKRVGFPLWQHLMALIVLVAFCAQSFLPNGFMPSFHRGASTDSFLQMTICHGNDLVTILVDKNMNPVAQDKTPSQPEPIKGVKPCSLMAVSHAVMMAALMVVSTILFEPQPIVHFVHHDVPRIVPLAHSFDSHAPPSDLS